MDGKCPSFTASAADSSWSLGPCGDRGSFAAVVVVAVVVVGLTGVIGVGGVLEVGVEGVGADVESVAGSGVVGVGPVDGRGGARW